MNVHVFPVERLFVSEKGATVRVEYETPLLWGEERAWTIGTKARTFEDVKEMRVGKDCYVLIHRDGVTYLNKRLVIAIDVKE